MNDSIAFVLAMNNWTPEYPRWRGNGYVGIPPSHPLYWKHYNDVSIDIHWDLTYSGNANDLRQGGIVWDYRVLGFDTAHADDDLHTRPRQKVVEETLRLKTIVDSLSKWTDNPTPWTEPRAEVDSFIESQSFRYDPKYRVEKMRSLSKANIEEIKKQLFPTPQTEPIELPNKIKLLKEE